jgi:hypothetical protein
MASPQTRTNSPHNAHHHHPPSTMNYLLKKSKSLTSLVSKKTLNSSPPSQTPPVPPLPNHLPPDTFTFTTPHPRYTFTVIDPEGQQVYSTTMDCHYLKEGFKPSAYPHPDLPPMTWEECIIITARLLPDMCYHPTIKTKTKKKQKTNTQN